MGAFIDLTGQKFGRLTVIKKLDKRGNENALKLIKQYRNGEDAYRNDWYKLIIRW